MRALWKGSISFGLVTIPVKLVVSSRDRRIPLKLICPECMGEVGYKRVCKNCGAEVSLHEAKRGYKVAGNMAILEPDELHEIKPKSSKIIEIKKFVPKEKIEPIFLKKSYYIIPDTAGEKGYTLLREALAFTGKVAIGKVTIREKEEIVAITVYKEKLLMTLLYYPSEVVYPEEIEIEEANVSDEEINLAVMLVDKLSGDLELSEFRDEYIENLKKLIDSKLTGMPVEVKVEKQREELKQNIAELLKIRLEG